MKRDSLILAVAFCILVFCAGVNVKVVYEFGKLRKAVVMPSWSEIHKNDCETCGCHNKADVYLVVDLGRGSNPVHTTYMCSKCYSNYVVDMAAPEPEITFEKGNGRNIGR